ncbi:MAG: methyltransferase domain-containing protein [Saprospiraceae bacterium]|nr:methyltransferase domain-containing protein [Saprospiraceae bacterium]
MNTQQSQIVLSPFTASEAKLIQIFDNQALIAWYLSSFEIDITPYLEGKDHVSLYECLDTGYQFYYPFEVYGDEAFYDAFSKRYAWYYQPDRWEYRICQKIFNFKGKDVLEVGCGNGHFLERIQPFARRIKGLELNTKAIAHCHQRQIDVEAQTIQDFAVHHQAQFDVVAMFQVLEHIADVSSFLTAALACLKKGGALVIAVPNNDSLLLHTNHQLEFVNSLHQHCLLMNMPPHHAGRWNKTALSKLPQFYPLHLEQLRYEPIWYYRTHYLQMLQYRAQGWAFRTFRKENLAFKMYFKLAQPYIKGHTILGVYRKE